MSTPTLLSLSAGLFLVGLCLAALRFYGQAIFSAVETLAATEPPEFYPHVTLLKSIGSLESTSYANLASFCQQDYPQYCIRFVVPDRAAPSIELVQRLIRQFPQQDIQLVSSADLGQIPPAMSSKLWVLADGNIRVSRDYLQQMVQPFHAPSVGIVLCPRSIYSHPWLTQFATLSAIELSARALVSRCSEPRVGCSLAIRADLLAKLVGNETIHSLPQFMAVIRRREQWTALGYRMVLSACAVEQSLSRDGGLGQGIWRELEQQIRWAHERRLACPQRYLQQGLTYGTVYSLLLIGLTQGAAWSWAMLGCSWTAELTMLCLVGWSCLNERSIWRLGWLLPIFDLLSLGIWICGFFGQPTESQVELRTGLQAASQAVDSNYAVERKLSVFR